MGFAARLFGLEGRSLESPSVPLSSASLVAYLDGAPTASGASVSEGTALGLTAYLRAISLISGSLAMLPIRVYYRGSRQLVTLRTVLDSPSLTQTPFEFWQSMVAAQLSWGNAYCYKRRNGRGDVTRCTFIHPSRVAARVEGDSKVFDIVGGDGRLYTATDYEVAHFPFLSPDGVSGLSPLQACRQALGGALAAEGAAAAFFGNGARLSGLVKTQAKLTASQAEDLASRWEAKFSGPSNAGRVAILDAGADFQSISLPPEDAQLLQTRAFSVSEIARMFGVPSHLLNDQEKATSWGSGIESMGIGYVVYTLGPRVKHLEERISRELLPGGWESGAWDARFDLKGLLRGDTAARAAMYGLLMDRMILTNRDVAELEDMDPPEREVYVTLANYSAVDPVSGEVTPLSGQVATAVQGGPAAEQVVTP